MWRIIIAPNKLNKLTMRGGGANSAKTATLDTMFGNINGVGVQGWRFWGDSPRVSTPRAASGVGEGALLREGAKSQI